MLRQFQLQQKNYHINTIYTGGREKHILNDCESRSMYYIMELFLGNIKCQ